MSTLGKAVVFIVTVWILAGLAFWRAFCWLHYTLVPRSRR